MTVATKEQLAEERIDLLYRDNCSGLLIPLNRCVRVFLIPAVLPCCQKQFFYARVRQALLVDAGEREVGKGVKENGEVVKVSIGELDPCSTYNCR